MKLTQTPQSLIHIMKAMGAGKSWDCIITTMAKRLRSPGMAALREDTKKWATALSVQVEMDKDKTKPAYDDT